MSKSKRKPKAPPPKDPLRKERESLERARDAAANAEASYHEAIRLAAVWLLRFDGHVIGCHSDTKPRERPHCSAHCVAILALIKPQKAKRRRGPPVHGAREVA